MNKLKIALFGHGGHAKEVAAHIGRNVTYFVDDKYARNHIQPISKFDPNYYTLMIAIGDPILREKIVSKLPKNIKYFTFIHPSTIILSKDIKIGQGTFIGANCILTNSIKIGEHCILNRSVNIGHDCNISNYVSLMPGVIISGNVDINKKVFIGSSTVINEKISISANIIIGSNSTVIDSIKLKGTYAGNPIRQI